MSSPERDKRIPQQPFPLTISCFPALAPNFPIAITFAVLLAVTTATTHGQSIYQTIKSFGFPNQSSSWPTTSVIEGPDGALFGTTENGGSNNFGTVYKVNKDGSGFVMLKSFSGTNGDGSRPMSGLLLATDGLLYGTTAFGGTSNRGTLFRLSADGTQYEILQRFTGANGTSPQAGLAEGDNGFIYGTTLGGGISNRGTVFRLSKDDGTCIPIKSFLGSDGANPVCRLVQGGDGALYGTTRSGGDSNSGTVFKLTIVGGGYQVLKEFSGANDGASPYGGVIFGTNGALFGTTRQGGDLDRGTLFILNVDGTGHAILKSFGGPLSDNGFP